MCPILIKAPLSRSQSWAECPCAPSAALGDLAWLASRTSELQLSPQGRGNLGPGPWPPASPSLEERWP